MTKGNRFSLAALAAVIVFGTGCITITADDGGSGWGWNAEKASREFSRTIDGGGIDTLRVHVGAGGLEIRGEDRSDVSIEGTITSWARKAARAEEILSGVELRDRTRGSTLELEPDGPAGLHNEGYAIDLTLVVPADLALEIEDGSGSIRIENVQGGIRIDDGSGGIELEHVGGRTRITDGSGEIIIRDLDTSRGGSGPDEVRIHDGSGEIDMSGIVGRVRIEDGSGGIEVAGVQGSVEINDGSGNLRLTDITGPVRITDGSGSMWIRNVFGDVGISDGSGGITVDAVTGDLRVYSDGSGGIDVGEVSGTVERP